MDYYDEGALIWLEADTIIRQNSGGKKSMDDFAHLFHGGQNTPPEVKTYTFDDVVDALNQVQPYDWRGFLTDRVLKIAEHAPLGGITNSGWMLVYNDQPNTIAKLREQEGVASMRRRRWGWCSTKDGVVVDAIEDGIAARNGIGPGMKIIAVNGRRYSQEFLLAAMREAQKSHQPIQLLVENTEYFPHRLARLLRRARYPHLVRDVSKPDLLGDIIKPKVTTLPQPFQGAGIVSRFCPARV